jgi:hypothetical protein
MGIEDVLTTKPTTVFNERLSAVNAELVEAQENALTEINKIMHACFVSGSYQGRMKDISAAADNARRIISESIKEVT